MDVEGYGFNREFLKKHPDIAAIVWEAINNDWEPERFQARVQNTSWWKSKTDAQRKWDVLATNDPKEQERVKQQNIVAIRDLAGQMGVTLSPGQIDRMAREAGKNGLDQTEMQDLIAAKWNPRANKGVQSGAAGASIDGLRQMAQDYGIRLSDSTLQGYTRQILAGEQTVDGFRDSMREQSKRLYKTVATELDNGATVRDLMSPYMEAAAQALGVAVSDMNMTDPKWTKALRSMERSGEAMDMDEWTNLLRNDARYGWDQTSGANQAAAQFSTQLAQLFGGQG